MDSAHPATERISRHCYRLNLILVLGTFEREYKDRENSILVKVLGIFESLPACQAGHYGSSYGESYSSDIRRLPGKRGSSFLRQLA